MKKKKKTANKNISERKPQIKQNGSIIQKQSLLVLIDKQKLGEATMW